MAERVDSIDGVKSPESPESPANPENPAASAASAASGMRAADVGRAARQDLQFRIPRKPVVRLGVRMRPEDETWVLEGGRKRQVLGGAFAREHLGALLQACDGTRTLDQIAEAMGIGPGGAFEAVSLLWTGGIVEEGDTDPLPDPQPAPELACLLSRLGESTGVNDSWQDAARRLAAARVAVLGDVALADDVVSALSPTLAARAAAIEPGDTLAVVVETAEAAETGDDGSAINRCWELGVPLLRVRAEHDAVTIGPYIDPSFSPCPQCATAGESDPGPVPGPDRRDLAVGMAARAVAALIARATMIHLPGDIRRIDLETFRHTDHPVTTRPGCPICSITGGSGQADESDGPSAPVAQSAPVGARYEQAVAIPPAGFVDSKGHQQHYKPSNLRLQREFRDWPNCPRTLLPDADLERLNRPWPLGGAGAQAAGSSGTPVSDRTVSDRTDDGPEAPIGRPTLTELATVLALAVGVREPLRPQEQDADAPADASKLRRWTAAGGNIGSVTAYVLVPDAGASGAAGSPAPLAPGVYTYIERDHALAQVGPPPSPASQGSDGPGGSTTPESPEGPEARDRDAGVRIVLTGNVDKLSKKYMAFALRLAIQDCGCSLETLRIVARCLDLPLRAQARWDERELSAAIGVDPAREPIVAVVDLGGRHAH